jgi:hypothetical protein
MLSEVQRTASLSPRIWTLKNDERWAHERASTAAGAAPPPAAAQSAEPQTTATSTCLKEVEDSREYWD